MHRLTATLSLALSLAWWCTAQTTPAITSVSGGWGHGSTVQIAGSGFGSKSPAAPLWWDDGEGQPLNSHSALSGRYNDAWPYAVTENGGYSNIQYRAAGHRDVSAPHPHSTVFAAGCHDDQGECQGGEVGQNVGLTVSDGARHAQWYVSYYVRLDPQWPPASAPNYKYFNWETSSPYRMYSSPFCYDNVNGCAGGYNGDRRAPDCAETWWGGPHAIQVLDYGTCGDWIWNDDGDPSDYGWPVITYDRDVRNPRLQWVRQEHILSTAGSPLLYYRTLVDNVPMLDTTADLEGDCQHSSRAANDFGGVTIGGFWKEGVCGDGQDNLNDNACRFFDDVYVDSTFARVVLADASPYESARVIEPQIPVEWSDGGITVTVNRGAITGDTAWLYVFDANDLHSAGVEVDLTGTQPDTPEAPQNLRITH